MAITNGDIGVSQPAASTITMKVGTVVVERNSTSQHQELLTIADPESTSVDGMARVLAAAPDSTSPGLVVRQVGHSTTVNVSSVSGAVNMRSSAANALVTVYQSSAADLQAQVAQASTDWAAQARTVSIASTALQGLRGNSSASDYIPVRIVDSSGTGFLSPGLEFTDGSTYSSLAGVGLAFNNSSNNTFRLAGSSTPLPIHLRTSSGTEIGASTSAPTSNGWGLHVRPIPPMRRSAVSTVVSTASSAFYTLVSSAANTKYAMRGYSVTSTAATPFQIDFLSGTNTVIWHTGVGSGSSGMTGANFGLDSGLCETAIADPLRVRLASTGVEVKFSIAYHLEA